jgi:CheY-like chemotaxis protein
MLPEFDGWTVCREIRKVSQVPIIMLTARSEDFDEVHGFEIGADSSTATPVLGDAWMSCQIIVSISCRATYQCVHLPKPPVFHLL